MNPSDQNREIELLREKHSRHEKILIQAYKNIKQKENQLKELNEELLASDEELRQLNEELQSTNEQLQLQKEELEATLIKLKSAQSQLIQSEKMASIGVLTAGIAHEINNPLNYIMSGYAGLDNYLRETHQNNEEVSLLLNNIKTGVIRAANIVKGLNQFSRDNNIYDEDCDIHSIVNNCLIMLHNQLKGRIEVRKYFSGKAIRILGNVGQLHQVFINILMNSMQAIEKKGTISIKTQKREKDIIIEISDTGYGISDENISKITDPFFTTKNPGQGTGLGLSITYTIIKKHKGKLNFESSIHKGSTVKIVLPLSNY